MSEMALALFVLCAAACASSSPGVTPKTQQPGHDIAPYTVSPAPTTIRVDLDESSRDALVHNLGARALKVARLILREVRPSGAETLKGVRIFVEKPDADLNTPIEDAHYAGSFVLGFTPSDTINLNIAPALAKVWASGALTAAAVNERKSITITFVPEPWEPARRMPPAFSLTIQSAALDVPRS